MAANLTRRCPKWVVSGHCIRSAPCPLFPRKRTFCLWLRACLMPPAGLWLARGFAVSIALLRKNLRLRSIVCAARHGLPRVMLLSKAWGKRRVSACVSVHHCHWDWHSSRICTVVFITRGGEWDSFRPNALTCSARQKAA